MKKALLIIFGAAAIFCSNAANAQNYSLDKDTAKATVYHNGFTELKIKVTNTASHSYKLTWKVVSHTLPIPAWTINGFGICDNETCVNFNKDDATLTASKETLPFAPSESFDYKMQIEVSSIPTGGPYYVTTNITDGTTSKTAVFELTNRFPTSVTTINRSKEDVVMYPNPARDELNVIYNGNSSIKNIAVYNLIGKVVNVYKVTSNNNANLDISSIPSGIYFIRLVDAQGRVVATRKFTHQ